MGQVFQFKQFAVDQNNVPMRINTDGVLLGATAGFHREEAVDGTAVNPGSMDILDIGTGTGVIALMLAQRFEQANVWGVEIDELAAETAGMNFKQSPFKDRMQLVHGDIFHWQTELQFDLIVSNPPFYLNSLHNPDQRKKVAKHTDDTFFKGMIKFASERLKPDGQIQLIVPIEMEQFLIDEAVEHGLEWNGQCNIRSFEDSDSFRCIISFARKAHQPKTEEFIIYKGRGIYSDAYNHLLEPFFLAF
ncbi:UNVERIFIED_CONTAM: tRNA1(Val) (adenine(37)-N6)-methyltransferase [Trichonephila clavipes]